MTQIKISTITLLTTFGIIYIFFKVMPSWLSMVLSIISLIALCFLNFEALRTKGSIKKLIIWADAILITNFVIFFIPAEVINLVITNYIIMSLSLVFMGLIVAVLVNAYYAVVFPYNDSKLINELSKKILLIITKYEMIKPATIFLLISIGIGYAFSDIIPLKLGLPMGAISIIALIIINIKGLRVAGPIKKLVLSVDVAIILMILLTFITFGPTLATFMYYLTNTIFLLFSALLVALLVKVYNVEVK